MQKDKIKWKILVKRCAIEEVAHAALASYRAMEGSIYEKKRGLSGFCATINGISSLSKKKKAILTLFLIHLFNLFDDYSRKVSQQPFGLKPTSNLSSIC